MKFKNSVNAISLFANVGIAETYLDALGVKVKVANELIEERANFYRHLYPSVARECLVPEGKTRLIHETISYFTL